MLKMFLNILLVWCFLNINDLGLSTFFDNMYSVDCSCQLDNIVDFQVMASASSKCGLIRSQICLWDLSDMVCKHTLTHHEHNIVALSYSRDDRFLISLGQ